MSVLFQSTSTSTQKEFDSFHSQISKLINLFANITLGQIYPSISHLLQALNRTYTTHKNELLVDRFAKQHWSEEYKTLIKDWKGLERPLFISSDSSSNLNSWNWYKRFSHDWVKQQIQDTDSEIYKIIKYSIIFQQINQLRPDWFNIWQNVLQIQLTNSMNVLSFRIKKISIHKKLINCQRALMLYSKDDQFFRKYAPQFSFSLYANMFLYIPIDMVNQFCQYGFEVVGQNAQNTQCLVTKQSKIMNLTKKYFMNELESDNYEWRFYTQREYRKKVGEQVNAWGQHHKKFKNLFDMYTIANDIEAIKDLQDTNPVLFEFLDNINKGTQIKQLDQNLQNVFINDDRIIEERREVSGQFNDDQFENTNIKTSFFVADFQIHTELVNLIVSSKSNIQIMCVPSVNSDCNLQSLENKIAVIENQHVKQITQTFINTLKQLHAEQKMIQITTQLIKTTNLDNVYWQLMNKQRNGTVYMGNVGKEVDDRKQVIASSRFSEIRSHGLDVISKFATKQTYIYSVDYYKMCQYWMQDTLYKQIVQFEPNLNQPRNYSTYEQQIEEQSRNIQNFLKKQKQ